MVVDPAVRSPRGQVSGVVDLPASPKRSCMEEGGFRNSHSGLGSSGAAETGELDELLLGLLLFFQVATGQADSSHEEDAALPLGLRLRIWARVFGSPSF